MKIDPYCVHWVMWVRWHGAVKELHVTGHQISHNSVYSFAAPVVDHSRVILQGRDPNIPGSDYINANYVKVRLLKAGSTPKVGGGAGLPTPAALLTFPCPHPEQSDQPRRVHQDLHCEPGLPGCHSQ